MSERPLGEETPEEERTPGLGGRLPTWAALGEAAQCGPAFWEHPGGLGWGAVQEEALRRLIQPVLPDAMLSCKL